MRMNSVFVFGVLAALTSTAAASGQHGTTGGLSDLPQAAQSTISAALGRDMTGYAVRIEPGGLQTENTQQHLVSTFTASELEVRSGLAIWRMNLTGYGYGTALTPVATAVPEAEGNRVQYRRGRLTEWYINGPLGLEQGFTISRPPGQSRGRELTIELALSGNLVAF